MKNILFIVIVFALTLQVNAQDKRIELKLGGALIASWSKLYDLGDSREGNVTDHYNFGSAGYSIEAHYYIKPNLAIGASYARSPKVLEEEGSGDFKLVNKDGFTTYGRVAFLQYGISGKYTTSRARRFNAYTIVKLYYMQRVFYDFEDGQEFTIGNDGFAVGIGGGIGLKISKSFGLNLFEVSYNHYITGMDFSKDTFGQGELYLGFGLVFNLIERK